MEPPGWPEPAVVVAINTSRRTSAAFFCRALMSGCPISQFTSFPCDQLSYESERRTMSSSHIVLPSLKRLNVQPVKAKEFTSVMFIFKSIVPIRLNAVRIVGGNNVNCLGVMRQQQCDLAPAPVRRFAFPKLIKPSARH